MTEMDWELSNDETLLAAERDVIGAALLDPDLIRSLSEEVSPEDFYQPAHEHVWRVLLRRWLAQDPISEVLVAQEIAEAHSVSWARTRGVDFVALFDMKAAVGAFPATARHHARLIHEGAMRRRIERFAVRLRQASNSSISLPELMTVAREEFEAVKRSTSTDMQSITLGELLEGTDEYDWVLPHLMERGDRVIITGAEGGGKTTLGRQVCVLAAAGINPITFEDIPPVRVQVVDCENTERQWRRKVRPMTIRAAGLGAVDPRVAMNLSFPGRIQITSEKHLGAIHRLLDRNKPDMLYIGPIYKMSNGGLNSEEDAAGVLAALDSIRERGVSLVIEAHAGHTLNGEKGTRNLRPRGSSALLGWPEIGFGLRTDPEAPNESIVERWRGDRDEMAWPSRFKRGGDWPWTPVVSMQEAVDQIGRAIEYGDY